MATPSWNAPQNTFAGVTSQPSDVNQLLGTHTTTFIYEGETIFSNYGNNVFDNYQPLYTTEIDQPFTMSGTELDRILINIQTTGIGAPLLARLYADSGGSPTGSPLAQVTIPTSFLANQSDAATLQQAILGTWAQQPNLSVNVESPALATDGASWVLTMGGGTPEPTPFASIGALGPSGVASWSATTPMPSGAISPAATYDPKSQLVIMGGGWNGTKTYYNTCWTGTIAGGTVQSWSTATQLPTNTYGSGLFAVNGYIYLIGGTSASGPLKSVYVATITNGTLGTWTTTTSLPITSGNVQGAVIADTEIIIGDPTSGKWFISRDASSGSIASWTQLPSTPSDATILGACMVNASDLLLITTTGAAYVMHVTSAEDYSEWLSAPGINPSGFTGFAMIGTSYGPVVITSAQGAGQNLSFVTSAQARTLDTGSSPSVSIPLTSLSGNNLVLVAYYDTYTTGVKLLAPSESSTTQSNLTITDTASNIWTFVYAIQVTGTYGEIEVWVANNANPVTGVQVAVATSFGPAELECNILELQGNLVIGDIDVAGPSSASVSGATTTMSITTAPFSVPNDFLLSFMSYNQGASNPTLAFTSPGGTSLAQQDDGSGEYASLLQYSQLSSTAALTETGTASVSGWQSLLYVALRPAASVQTQVWFVPSGASRLVSIPLQATGLTSGSTYHIVLNQTDTDPGNYTSVLLVKTAGTTAQYSNNGGPSWTAFATGTQINLGTCYNNGATGRKIHTLQDISGGVPARMTWTVFQGNGQPAAYGEITGNMDEFRVLSYNQDGTLGTVT